MLKYSPGPGQMTKLPLGCKYSKFQNRIKDGNLAECEADLCSICLKQIIGFLRSVKRIIKTSDWEYRNSKIVTNDAIHMTKHDKISK